jgi:hypothetical protein
MASETATKAIALPTSANVSPAATAPRGEAEHEADYEVLGDEDRQPEVCLVVRQAAEVDQPLDGDRARGDVDRRGEDERAEAEPERRHSDREAEARVDEKVDRPADKGVVAAAHEAAERELQAEEEEQEDEPDLGNEVSHLGRADEAERFGSFGPSRRPASGYAGIADSPMRLATSPSAGSKLTVIESSASVIGRCLPA